MPGQDEGASPQKQPSGAQNRKRARERANAAAKPGQRDWSKEFADLGEPDLEDPSSALVYARRVNLLCIRMVATSPFLTLADQARLRMLKDFIATLGMTHSRSTIEGRVKSVEAKLAGARKRTGAIKLEPANAIARPETARGRRGARGPRPLPGSSAGVEAGENEGNDPLGGGTLGQV